MYIARSLAGTRLPLCGRNAANSVRGIGNGAEGVIPDLCHTVRWKANTGAALGTSSRRAAPALCKFAIRRRPRRAMAPLGSFYSSGPGPVGPTEGLIPIRSPGGVAQFATSSASESSAAAIRASTALATLDPDAANVAFAPCSLARVTSAARKRRTCSDASRTRESVSRDLRSAGSSAKMAVARPRRTRHRGPKAEAADPLAAEAATQHCPESDGCGRGRPIQRGLVIAGWVMVRGHAESSRKKRA